MKISFKDKNVSVKVSHLYTYGTENPTNLKTRYNDVDNISIEVDINEIESLIGDIVDPIKFNMFKYATLGITQQGNNIEQEKLRAFATINSKGDGYLTQKQMERIIYNKELHERHRVLGGNLYYQNKHKEYNADIAYILGSFTTELSENNKYYFKNGKLSHIEYETKVDFNDFDNDSSSLLAKLVKGLY